MSGVIGLIANQAARYTLFTESLTGLFGAVPPGTIADWEVGGAQGISRNTIIKRAFIREAEWVFFVDDDHTFPPTILTTLLAHDLPVVSALYLQRVDPFMPIAFTGKDENGAYQRLDINNCPGHGLVPVIGVGAGGLLVKTEVFRQIPEPWFMHTLDSSEDLHFSSKLVEEGIPIFVDLDARMGHVLPISIYPAYEDGRWAAGLATGPFIKILLPINQDGTDA